MNAPRDLSRTTSSNSSQETTISQNATTAALRGATTAFGRPAANGRAPNNNLSGALAAATSAGSRSGTSPARPLVSSRSGSEQSVKSNAARDVTLVNGSNMSSPNLPLPPPPRGQSKSPSQEAAVLAAARAPPPSVSSSAGNNNNGSTRPRTAITKSPAVPPKPRRLSSYSSTTDTYDRDKPTDATPIAPTTSLIDMFENKTSSPQSTGKKPDPLVIKSSGDLPLRSPKPVRTSGGITSMIQMELENSKSSPAPVANDFANGTSTVLKNDKPTSGFESPLPSSKSTGAPKPPEPPPRKRDAIPGAENTHVEQVRHSNTVRGRSMPPPSPLRSNITDPIPIQRSDKPATSPTETFSPSSASAKSITAQYNLLHPRKMTPNMTGDQLANAMVAGSLASSRQASPTRGAIEPPPLPTRRHKHHTFSLSRTPSPSKAAGMKKTLRQTQSDVSDDEDDERLYPYSKHKVQKSLGKHPNKHHEGDRKRWRESVTEHERKRYEGVWAANKGLYYSFTPEEQKLFSRAPDSQQARDIKEAVSDQVSNIVAREIWARSRLPDTVLETVWDLVDHDHVGRLSKEEFVVGLWLIDGRLKGKKLPVKVSDSVWRSVKGLQKIKIKK